MSVHNVQQCRICYILILDITYRHTQPVVKNDKHIMRKISIINNTNTTDRDVVRVTTEAHQNWKSNKRIYIGNIITIPGNISLCCGSTSNTHTLDLRKHKHVTFVRENHSFKSAGLLINTASTYVTAPPPMYTILYTYIHICIKP